MRDKKIYQLHAEICQALIHPLRLEIIDHLRDGEKTVSQLVEATGAPQSTISRHLRKMRVRDIVVTRKDGMNTYYRLGSERIVSAYDEMHLFVVESLGARSELFAAA